MERSVPPPEGPKESGKLKFLFVIVALAGTGAAVWFFLNQAPLTLEQANKAMWAQDRKNLESTNARPAEIFGALVRLGALQDENALAKALAYAGSGDTAMRRAAASALGFYESQEAHQALGRLLTDSELSVRLYAIRGVGRKGSAKRDELLQNRLNQKISDKEALEIRVALLRSSPSKATKEKSLQYMLKKLERSEVTATREFALIKLMAFADRDQRVVKIARKVAGDLKENPLLRASAVRHLSAIHDQWMDKRLEIFVVDTDPKVRHAAVSSIHLVCPKGRWQLLNQRMKTERSEYVLGAIVRQSLRMPGEQAKAMLEKALKLKVLPTKLLDQASINLEKLEKVPAKDPCQNRVTRS